VSPCGFAVTGITGRKPGAWKMSNMDRKTIQKPSGRPVSDDRGNATWEWNVEGDLDTQRLKALTDGLALEDAPATGAQPKTAGLNPYEKAGKEAPKPEAGSKPRTLDDMRRLSEEIKRKKAEKG
jgi:hypothetical protein